MMKWGRLPLVAFCVVAMAAALHASLPPMPQASSSLGAITSDGWLYIYGGHTGKTHQYSTETVSGSFRRIKLADGSAWEELPGGPGVQGMNLAAWNGRIYRVGGMQPRNKPDEPADNHSIADAAYFDPAMKQWKALPSLPEPRSSHDAVALDGKLYVVGGWIMGGADSSSRWPANGFVIDLSKPDSQWEKLPTPFQRRALTAAAMGGKLYVLGGLTESGEAVQRVDIYDTSTKTWSEGPAYPGKSTGFSAAACTVGGKLYLSTLDGQLHRLSAKGDQWETVGSLAVPRMVHRMAAASDASLVVVGGASRNGDAKTLELIDLKQSPKQPE